MRHRVVSLAVWAMLGVCTGHLNGQAVCSAPHSSPVLAQGGAIGTLPQRAGWIQLSLLRQRSDAFFDSRGERRSFLAGSEFLTRSVYLTGALGLLEGFELWAQVPMHHLGVESQSGTSTSSGVGDVRLALRIGPGLIGSTIPLALRVGAKLPGSEFPVDATVLPLTEGQRDWEVSLESGQILGGSGMYVTVWVGYRWRGANRPAAREPGDERFAHLAVGGSVGLLSWEVGSDALWGAPPLASGIILTEEGRRLLQILPTLGFGVGPGRLELTGQIPVWGKNLPSGVGLSLGYRTTWGLR